jgi:radical SAM superfamily enzyme YgiQ (UPF0313 family)
MVAAAPCHRNQVMKIVLLSSNTATTPYPVYPLGMSVVAAALQRAGHETALYDLLAMNLTTEQWREALRREKPGLVGISIRNLDNVNLLHEKRYTGVVAELVRCVHEETGVPVVLGGSGYSLLPEQVLAEAGADYGIVGEGERLTVALAAALEKGERPAAGTIFRSPAHMEGPAVSGAYYSPSILQKYMKEGSIAPVQTKRGCNLRCTYCAYPVLEGGKFRCRPVGEVVDDIERLLKEHQAPYIFFTDSVFNDDEGQYLEILREMKRRGIKAPWSAFLKPTGIDKEAAILMKETGLAGAELGSDATTDATLRGLRKSFRWADVIAANDVLRAQDIAVAHYFMFGGPDETRETVLEGIENIRNLKCSAAFVFLGIRILPHTELHQRAIREGLMAAERDLLEPVYYVSPLLDREWVEKTLKEAFAKLVHVVYPPDALDDKLQLLHKLGYVGSLWEMLSP